MSATTITTTTPPSKLAVGDTPGDDWRLARHKGNRVRYQNTRTAAWDRAFSLEPGDTLYRELDTTLYPPKPAPESAAKRLSDDMGQIDPTDPPLELDDLSDVPSAPSSFPEADVEYAYESLTRDQLRKIASERGIKGRGSMNKDQLVAALRG